MYGDDDMITAIDTAHKLEAMETTPDYGIFEEFTCGGLRMCFDVYKKQLIEKYFNHEKSFYFTNRFGIDTNSKYIITDNPVERHLYKRK